jgi:hypothetical protein
MMVMVAWIDALMKFCILADGWCFIVGNNGNDYRGVALAQA